MVQDIEELSAELQGHPLSDRRVLVKRHVPLFEGRTRESIATQASEMPRSGDAICCCSRQRACAVEDRGLGCAGHGKRTEVEKVTWLLVIVNDRPDHVRPVVAFAAPAVVILGVVVEREGLAALQCHCTIDPPAVLHALPATAHHGQLVADYPGETLRYVEVRWTTFGVRIRAVLGLGRIGDKVLAVA